MSVDFPEVELQLSDMGSSASRLHVCFAAALLLLLTAPTEALTCKHFDEATLKSNLQSNRCDQLDLEKG